jgi:hypothetical protein
VRPFRVGSGVLAREVVLEDTVSTELLGAGDLIRPWADGGADLLRPHIRWQVLSDVRLVRRADARWLPAGDPGRDPAAAVRRVVSHRRRLLEQEPMAPAAADGRGA